MAPMPARNPVVEQAAHLVAYWEDVRTTEPHELRAHLTLRRMCTAAYETLDTARDLHITTSFVPWPIRKDPLTVVVLVGRVDGVVRATMREGADHDMAEHYSRTQLRQQLDEGDYGILGSWAPWVNAYFLNAIRDALFGISRTGEQGAVWEQAREAPNGAALNSAHAAIEAALPHIPSFQRIPRALAEDMETQLGSKAPNRFRMIWRRVAQLDVRIPPQNIPLDRLRGRSPPPGMPRKGNALTLTEQLVVYLCQELGMNYPSAAEALEMNDWRQVRNAAESADRKRKMWYKFAPSYKTQISH